MLAQEAVDHSATVARHLPYLRRYARALTGNQTSGDRYAVAVLESIIADPNVLKSHANPKVSLFSVFHSIWSTSGAPVAEADDVIAGAAQAHMAGLTRNSREALLLNTVEGFETDEVAAIMGVDVSEAQHLVDDCDEEGVSVVWCGVAEVGRRHHLRPVVLLGAALDDVLMHGLALAQGGSQLVLV